MWPEFSSRFFFTFKKRKVKKDPLLSSIHMSVSVLGPFKKLRCYQIQIKIHPLSIDGSVLSQSRWRRNWEYLNYPSSVSQLVTLSLFSHSAGPPNLVQRCPSIISRSSSKMGYVHLFLDLKNRSRQNACLITDHYLTLCVTVLRKGCTQAMV